MKRIFTIGFASIEILILVWALGLFFFGISRINSGIFYITDSYAKHFANVGLLYINWAILLLIFFFVLWIIKLYKRK